MKSKYTFVLNNIPFEWEGQNITVADLRKLANIRSDEEIYLKVQGRDELISEANPVDLARFGIEELYTRKAERFKFILNGKLFIWDDSLISGLQLRELGHIGEDQEIFLRVEGPDEKVLDDRKVDLAPFGIEEFYSRQKEKPALVDIFIDSHKKEITPGVHSVADIKKLGGVEPSYDLDELVNGELKCLPDDGNVTIKGCEEFFSHPKDGKSS